MLVSRRYRNSATSEIHDSLPCGEWLGCRGAQDAAECEPRLLSETATKVQFPVGPIMEATSGPFGLQSFFIGWSNPVDQDTTTSFGRAIFFSKFVSLS
jgi:hypothetical protein